MKHLYNILIGDDHELIIKGICNVLEDNFKVDIIETFTNPEEIIGRIKEIHFELYILDLEFQSMSGFDLIKAIRKEHTNARIIIVTMHEEIWNINYLQVLNVNGMILKKSSGEYLNKAVTTVMNNKQFLCPRFEELKARTIAYRRLRKSKNSQPSQTELTVLKHIVDGYSSKQIADILCVTEDTIEAHRKNLFLKLEARNAAHLVSIAIRQRLIE